MQTNILTKFHEDLITTVEVSFLFKITYMQTNILTKFRNVTDKHNVYCSRARLFRYNAITDLNRIVCFISITNLVDV